MADDSNTKLNNQSKFYQADFVLLISSISGFIFIFIGLIAIFVGRKLRHQRSNNAADFETQSPDTFEGVAKEMVIQTPMQCDDKIMNNSLQEDLYYPNMNDYYTKLSGIKRQCSNGERGENIEKDFTKPNKDIIRIVYPQFPMYDKLRSPNYYSPLGKPSIEITEITGDEDSPTSEDERMKMTSSKDNLMDNLPQGGHNDSINMSDFVCRKDGDEPGLSRCRVSDDESGTESSSCSVASSLRRGKNSQSYIEESETQDIAERLIIIKSPLQCLEEEGSDLIDATTWSKEGPVVIQLKIESASSEIHKIISITDHYKGGISRHSFYGDQVRGRSAGDSGITAPECQISVADFASNVSTETEASGNVYNCLIKSVGDNVNHDDLMRDTSETTSTSSFPLIPSSQGGLYPAHKVHDSITASWLKQRGLSKPDTGSSRHTFRKPKDDLDFSPSTPTTSKYLKFPVDINGSQYNLAEDPPEQRQSRNCLMEDCIVSDSVSSAENAQDFELIRQTNKNAYSDSEGGKVMEAVKRLERSSFDTLSYDFKVPLRIHKRKEPL